MWVDPKCLRLSLGFERRPTRLSPSLSAWCSKDQSSGDERPPSFVATRDGEIHLIPRCDPFGPECFGGLRTRIRTRSGVWVRHQSEGPVALRTLSIRVAFNSCHFFGPETQGHLPLFQSARMSCWSHVSASTYGWQENVKPCSSHDLSGRTADL